MLDQSLDEGVFIRSVASRGKLGGLSKSTSDIVRLLQFYGFDKIIIETVGAGQSEIDIVRNSDTTIVLTVPGLGDDIQIIKAGIMEIADIFVINKCDQPGTSGIKLQIKNLLDLIPIDYDWKPKIVETSTITLDGIEELVEFVEEHFNFLKSSDKLANQRKEQLRFDLISKLFDSFRQQLDNLPSNPTEDVIQDLLENKTTLSKALERLQSKLYYSSSND